MCKATDALVQDWFLKQGTPVSLHSDHGKEFTTALHTGVCDLLHIRRAYYMAYRPQAYSMVERCNRKLLVMLRTEVSKQQDYLGRPAPSPAQCLPFHTP